MRIILLIANLVTFLVMFNSCSDISNVVNNEKNTGPYNAVIFVPGGHRWFAGDSLSFTLMAHDDQNNIIDWEIQAPGFLMVESSERVKVWDSYFLLYVNQKWVAPMASGLYVVRGKVIDAEGLSVAVSMDLTLEEYGSNTAPVITEVWTETNVVKWGDFVAWRIKGYDLEGDQPHLNYSRIHTLPPDTTEALYRPERGYFDWNDPFPPMNIYYEGDSVIIEGVARPSQTGSYMEFRLWDEAVESAAMKITYEVDESTKPVIHHSWVTIRGERQDYSITGSNYFAAQQGEEVTFELEVSDPKGGELRYRWHNWTTEELLDGLDGMQGQYSPKMTFVMPNMVRRVYIHIVVWDENDAPVTISDLIFYVE